MNGWIGAILYLLLAPLAIGALAGVDRRLSARMQRRVGPPLAQPFYDLLKLMEKESVVVGLHRQFFLAGYLVFTIAAGMLFFGGGDLLIVLFVLTLASVFFVLGAYATGSPYSVIGAERELLLLMASEPMLLLAIMGMYLVTGSFDAAAVAAHPGILAIALPGVLFGLLYVLTIKLRKSPFDLSTSHHAHQELVKGITTEYSGRALAAIELAHWYETAVILGLIYLFFAPWPLLAVAATLGAYFLEILVDNACARMRWQWTLKSAWAVTLVAGGLNLVAVFLWTHHGG